MRPDHYRDLIIRAVKAQDDEMLDTIAQHLNTAEAALSILRAKGYGTHGMLIDATARQVPDKD